MKLALFKYFNNKINLCMIVKNDYYEISYIRDADNVVVHHGPAIDVISDGML